MPVGYTKTSYRLQFASSRDVIVLCYLNFPQDCFFPVNAVTIYSGNCSKIWSHYAFNIHWAS